MESTFRRISQDDFDQHLQPVLEELIAERLARRQPGHCMKVGNLSNRLMERLAEGLSARFGDEAQVHVLVAPGDSKATPLFITSSKLIELRNPLPNGDLRPPLLVFVPNDLRVSAEDSFSGATFEQVELAESYDVLTEQLTSQIPASLRTHAQGCLRYLRDRGWVGVDVTGGLRFLISLKVNGYEEEVVGAALCELGLIPDFGLLQDPSTLQNRLAKNHEAAKNLLYSNKSLIGRVLDLEIANEAITAPLIDFFATHHPEDPVGWTTCIATDRNFYGLSFDKWGEGADDPYSHRIFVEVVSLDLPEVADEDDDPRLQELKGQKVLVVGGNGPQSFKIKFRCSPAPATIPDVDHFRIQIIAREAGPTGSVKKKKRWDGARQEATQSFTKIRTLDWEEGWHFVRVLPHSADGGILPIVNAAGEPISVIGEEESADVPHESDLFYVIRDEEVIIDVPQRAVPRFPTLQHAIASKIYGAVAAGGTAEEPIPTRVSWQSAQGGRDQAEVVEFRFPGEGFVNIPLTRPLRQLEQAILAAPGAIARWQLSLHHSKETGISRSDCDLPSSEALAAFLTAREEVFRQIRGGGEEGRGLVELAVFSAIEDDVLTYAETYAELVSLALRKVETASVDDTKAALESLNAFLAVDSTTVLLTDFRGGQRTACLASPTHPLRLLWLAGWSRLARTWAAQLEGRKADWAPSVKQALFDSLALINFPACLTGPAGRILQCNDNIHPLWSVYTAGDEPDPRGLLAELCTALDLPEASAGGFSVNGDFVASRIRRYVTQHPYIQTLTLNCFNVGRGRIVADAMLALQRLPDTQGLRYDIRLFAENPEAPGSGEDLAELISPSSSLSAAEADVFATATGDHLSPKLTYAQKGISEFQDAPSDFPAHITLLFDIFPSQTTSARPPEHDQDSAPIHGLLQDFSIIYEEVGERIAWHKQPRHGRAVAMPEAGEVSDLLSGLSTLMSTAAATLATGQGGSILRPVSTLVLGPKQKALLHQVHEASDWVFTIDRSMGVEFFDHKPSVDRPEYLIDHSPDFSSNSGRRVVVTSRSHTEIRMLFEAVLQEHGLQDFRTRAASLLGELRVLSGRLALKLVSAPTHRAEALGLALGKLFLEYQSALRYQAVVPLDSHTDLLNSNSNSSAATDLAAEVSLKRTDLALFDFDWKSRRLICRLVEVKCYQNVGGSLEGLGALKRSIAEQLDSSEQAIRRRFNLELTPGALRPDRLIRTQEFRTLLEFYVERAARLGLMSQDANQEAMAFLNSMEEGFEIAFTRSALIFDFEKPGLEESLEENGIEYHRIGRNLIEMLVEALPASDGRAETIPFPDSEPRVRNARQKEESGPIEELRSRSFPLVTSASFLPQERDHTVDIERNVKSESLNNSQPTEGVAAPESTEPRPIVAKDPVLNGGKTRAAGSSANLPIAQPTDQDLVSPPPVDEEFPSLGFDESDPPELAETLAPDVLLGASGESPQYGHLAKLHGRSIALDLNQTQTISLFGVQGGGKSYTLGSIIEMATMPIPGVNVLPQPLATIVFHYSQTQDYKPEFTSMNKPNDDGAALKALIAEYGARAEALSDIVLLTPEGKLDARKAEYPDIEVLPLKFASSELQAGHWRFLMGAIGNQATYIRRLNQIMRTMRDNLTLAGLRAAVENAGLTDNLRDLAMMRLDLAATYIDDQSQLSALIKPGRLVIVDLRDEFIEKDEALGLFVVLLQLFSDATVEGRFFNKLVVFDEAHKYIDSPDLVEGLISVVREMRHKGTSILVASQDPPSVPISLIELSTQIILHRFNSPAWLKHIQKANASLSGLQPDHLARLKPGEAFIWSAKTTDRSFSTEAVKVQCRPRITKHGGDTKTAVQ